MPKIVIVRLVVESEKISPEDQQKYWLSLGMLLYLVKHPRLEIANMNRKLLKANDGANTVPFKELLHANNYVLDMKNIGLEIK